MNEHPIIEEFPGLVVVFAIAIIVMLLLDLGVFNKKRHTISSREALGWSLLWIGLAMGFSLLVYHYAGHEKFFEFQSAYWVEKALSVDNLFVFLLVFRFFKVDDRNKHKVLFLGIIGALVLRAIFIFAGAYLIQLTYLNKVLSYFGLEGFKYDINLIMTVFGLFLISAGIKSWNAHKQAANQDFNRVRGARLIRKLFKVTDRYDGGKFFTVENGKKVATPLLVVVGVIEFTDLLFAIDSIPAIFAISNDPFILYTSNIFAILGLRALFFLLDNFIYLFSKLQYGLAIILCFIGLKMIAAPFYHLPAVVSLSVIAGVLLLSVVFSLLSPGKRKI